MFGLRFPALGKRFFCADRSMTAGQDDNTERPGSHPPLIPSPNDRRDPCN